MRPQFSLAITGRVIAYTPPEETLIVHADQLRIYQVISNYIDNALKYSPADSQIDIEVTFTEQIVRVSVKDRGPGVTEEQRPHLFTAFQRGTSEAVERSPGLGLGLYVCREIMKLHGGSVGVEGRPGGGSNFYLEIPREGAK